MSGEVLDRIVYKINRVEKDPRRNRERARLPGGKRSGDLNARMHTSISRVDGTTYKLEISELVTLGALSYLSRD